MKNTMTTLLIITMIISVGKAQKVSLTSTAAPVFTSKDSALCKPWRLSSVEEFGVENPPGDKQKDDGIVFTGDGNVSFTKDGKAKTGTWSLDKARTNINLVFVEPKEQLHFKLIKVDDKSLKIEYQNPNLIRTVYNYSVVSK